MSSPLSDPSESDGARISSQHPRDSLSPPISPRTAKRPRKAKDEELYDQLQNGTNSPPALSNEVTIAQGLSLPLNQPVLDTFLYWCHERHLIHLRRKQGKPQNEWTSDPIFQSNKFANVFRVLDRGTQFVLTDVISKGEQSLEECCFRAILFRSFARISTYQLLTEALGGPPCYRTFTPELYENVLLPHAGAGKPIYGSSYFIPAPKEFKSQYPFQSTLRLISLMMRTGLPQKLADMKHMRDAHSIICVYPALGPFLGMQLLLDLNLTPHIDLSENEYAACGPGSSSCLASMFGNYVRGFELQAIQWLYREQHQHWARLGIADPPQLCEAREPGLNVVDIEHALCEVHKYMRARDRAKAIASGGPARGGRGRGRRGARGGRAKSAATPAAASAAGPSTRSLPKGPGSEPGSASEGTDGLSFDAIKSESTLQVDELTDEIDGAADTKSNFYSLYDGELTYMLPPKWLVPRPEKNYERPPPLSAQDGDDDDDADDEAAAAEGDVYEVSHIVTMAAGSRKCLVRWKGFGPDDDTWEDVDELRFGAAKESVEAYFAWPQLVADEIAKMQKEAERERERLRKADLQELSLLDARSRGGGAKGGSGASPPSSSSSGRQAATRGGGKATTAATRAIGLPLASMFLLT